MREGWENKTIVEIAKIVSGGTPKTKIKEYWEGEIAWITPADLGKLKTREVSITRRTITREGLEKSSAKLFPKNSVILSSRAPIGHLAINKVPMATNQGCRGIVPNDYIDVIYLFYFLKCNVKLLNDLGTGTTFKELSTRALGSVKIPIPPLTEQKQIVTLLDQAFATIDQAKANIEKNIANAKELFQSKLNEIFSQKGDGWEEKTLGEVCIISMGQSPKGTTYNSEAIGTPLINGPVEFGREPFSKTVMTKWTTEPTKLCQEGDLILCVRGSTTGRINIAGFEACIGRGVASIRYERNQEWMNFFIRCNQQNIYDLGTGSTFPNVSGKILSKLKFSEPKSIEIQNDLIQTMKKIDSDINRVIFLYKKKESDLEDLKKSLLQKAFAGELTKPRKKQKAKTIA